MRWSAVISCLALGWSLPPSLYAGDALQVTLEAVPLLVQGAGSGSVGRADAGPGWVAADSLVYSNTDFNFYDPPAWFPAGPGVTFADDLHLTLGGRLKRFWFFFHEPFSNVVPITVSFYANDPEDSHLGPLVAGPYSLGPYRWGAYKVAVTVNDTVSVGRDLWFAMRFESPTAGAVLANPPFVGGSHDVYYDFSQSRTATLSGAFANIYMQVAVEAQPVGIEAVTWSRVKALYHSRELPGKPGGP